MKTYRFEVYFTGKPLVRMEYYYNETTMYLKKGRKVLSTPITEEQLSRLHGLHANEQIRAASIFDEAYFGN